MAIAHGSPCQGYGPVRSLLGPCAGTNPTPTLYNYDTMAGFVYKVLEGVDMTTKLCFSSNVMLSGLVRRQEEILLLYLLPLPELSKQRERSTLFSCFSQLSQAPYA